MFISSINQIEIGATVTRHNVMSGSVFKYVDGNGTLYASFGMTDINNSQTYIGGKMRGDFTIILSDRKMIFEDDDGKNTMTTLFVNDLV